MQYDKRFIQSEENIYRVNMNQLVGHTETLDYNVEFPPKSSRYFHFNSHLSCLPPTPTKSPA